MTGPLDDGKLWIPDSARPRRGQGLRQVASAVSASPVLAPAAIRELDARERDLRRKAKKLARRREREARRRQRSK